MEQHPIVAFIEARLAEDEVTLCEAGDAESAPGDHKLYVWDDDYHHNTVVIPTSRARRKIEAKRKLLAAHLDYYGADDDEGYPIPTLSILAEVWSDHEDYAALVEQAAT
ncbi:DUF6221 family protein [Streptosporangium sp. NPDC051023]|uniref:DUF6221 family protein n=1 Tax=Streptosporangium sp. NPDC051023 TaxID=3155410 RepID=UPI00344BF9B2